MSRAGDYGWTRQVHEAGDRPVISDGFLSPYANGTPLEKALAKGGCVVLLGLAGMGKSTELRRARERARAGGATTVYVDAGQEADVAQALGDDQASAALALQAERAIWVFVDSLDESARLGASAVGELIGEIARALDRFPLARVTLVMACRTGSFDDAAKRAAEQLAARMHTARAAAGEAGAGGALRCYELAPLQRSDVARAAVARGLDEQRIEALQHELDVRELGVLASRPLTLEMLFELAAEGRTLPGSAAELFMAGCRLLCSKEATGLGRRLAVTRRLGVDARLAVTMRMAAMTQLGNFPRIVLGPARAGEPADEPGGVHAADIGNRPPDELIGRERVWIDSGMVTEVLGTALFDGDGTAFRWVHKELADFLASRYLLRRGFAGPQILDLLAYGEQRESLVPQLEGVARWIDEAFPETIRQGVIDIDPAAVLAGDVSMRSDDDKVRIARALLAHFEDGRLANPYDVHYAKLAGADLGPVLQPVVRDGRKRVETRLAAAQMAGACGIGSLAGALVAVAFDGNENYGLRVAAARAVCEAGESEDKRALRALLDIDSRLDPDDELRGVALDALWKESVLGIGEVFEHLKPPQASNYVGDYKLFVYRLAKELEGEMDAEVLPRALDWSVEYGWDRRLVEAIHARAMQHLDEPEIAARMADVIADKIAGYEDIRWFRERADARGLRTLLGAVLDRISSKELFFLSHRGLLGNDDVPWLLSWMDEETDPERLAKLGVLVRDWLLGADAPHYMTAVMRYHQDPQRYGMFRRLVLYDLDSQEAATLRKQHREHVQWREEMSRLAADTQEEEQAARRQYVQDDIIEALDGCEADDVREWITLAHALWLTEYEEARRCFWDRRLDASPGWQGADASLQHRILGAAARYLREQAPKHEEWLGKNLVSPFAAAGVHALALLAADAPDEIALLAPEVCACWAPVIIARHMPRLDNEVEEQLARVMVPHAHATIQSTFAAILDSTKSFIEPPPRSWWIPELTALILARLDGAALSKHAAELVLWLIPADPAAARPVVERLLGSPASDDESHGYLGAIAACALEQDARHYWPLIWQRIASDAALGRAILARAAHFLEKPPWLDALVPAELAALYQWLSAQVSPAKRSRGGAVTPEMKLQSLMRQVARALTERGSWETVAALRELADGLPDDARLRWLIVDAERKARAQAWQPATPDQILGLAEHRSRRLVMHGIQLQQAIVQVVNELDIEPRRVWARVAGDAHEPVTEVALTAVMREELERRLAEIVLCAAPGDRVRVEVAGDLALRAEAGIDPGGPGGTAIAVDLAIVPSWAEDPVQALAELDTRMTARDTRHGGLVLARFGGRAWSRREDHARRSRALRRDIDDTRARLVAHAAAIADRGEHAIAIAVADLRYDEPASAFRGIPWGGTMLERLAACDIEPRGFRSIGDSEHWQIEVAWPASWQERFGIAPAGLVVACRGKVSGYDLQRAREELSLAGAWLDRRVDMEPDFFVVTDDADDLAARLGNISGQSGEVPWPAPEFPPLETQVARALRTLDIFDYLPPVRGRQFFGRRDEKIAIRRRILSGESVGIFGLRKSGKTSLARAVTDALDPVSLAVSLPDVPAGVDVEPSACVVWLDAQGIPRSEAALRKALFERTCMRLRAAGKAVPDTGAHDERAALEAVLRAAIEVGQGRLCIAIDEYDVLFEGSEGAPAVPVVWFLRLVRALAQEHGGVSLLLIGRDGRFLDMPQIEGVTNPMLAWVHTHPIEMLSPADSDEILISLGKRVGLDVGAKTCKRARDWSGGHARLLRSYGSALLAVAREHAGSEESIATDELDPESVLDHYLDSQPVEIVQKETFALLSAHYPRAYALLEGLLGHPAEHKQVLGQHGGWRSPPARTLRRFGILLRGAESMPSLPRWLAWYGEEMLGMGAPAVSQNIS